MPIVRSTVSFICKTIDWNNLEAISITFPVFFTRPGALLRIRPPKRLLLMVFSPLMVILPMTFFTRTPKVPYTFYVIISHIRAFLYKKFKKICRFFKFFRFSR